MTGLHRTCPRWRCATLNAFDAKVCVECGVPLIPLAMGDLQPKASDPLDDAAEWDRRKALEETSGGHTRVAPGDTDTTPPNDRKVADQ